MSHPSRPAPLHNLRDLSGAAVISTMEHFAVAPGPTVDELVAVARQAGLPKASRRTIRGLVEGCVLASPRRVGRSWKYQNAAIGQVDVVGRYRSRRLDSRLIPAAVFVETGAGDVEQTRVLACKLLRAWQVELTADRARLETDPGALAAEAERAARMRRDAPLPRRVRMALEHRELAVLYAFAQMLGTPLSDQAAAEGAYQLERILGLRSGRGGQSRDLSDVMPSGDDFSLEPEAFAEALASASPQRIELARRVAESTLLWIPALRSVLLKELGAPIVDILGTWSQNVSPSMHVMMLGAFVHKGLGASDEETRQALSTFAPETLALSLLADRSRREWRLVLKRLPRYQRLRFVATLRSLGATAYTGVH